MSDTAGERPEWADLAIMRIMSEPVVIYGGTDFAMDGIEFGVCAPHGNYLNRQPNTDTDQQAQHPQQTPTQGK